MWMCVGEENIMKCFTVVVCFILWLVPNTSGQFRQENFRLVDGPNVDGPNVTRGRLEYRLNSIWHTVCGSGFALQAADAVCRIRGYHYAAAFGSVSSVNSTPGVLGQPIVRFLCSFSVLSTCTVQQVSDCTHSEDVGLACTRVVTPMRLVSEAGGVEVTDKGVGILQVFINGMWGTVCGDGFRMPEARAACRQLGFEDVSQYSTTSTLHYDAVSDSVPVWLTGVNCSPLLRSLRLTNQVLTDLRLCQHRKVDQSRCNHTTDVIVSCRKPGALRLIRSSSQEQIQASGRLELFWNGNWGRVCGTDISDTTALVACKQLGFNSVDCHGSISDLGISADTSAASRVPDVFISDVVCASPPFASLLQCSYTNGSSDCQLNVDDLALSCYTTLDVNTRNSSCSRTTNTNHTLPAILGSVAVVVVILAIVCTILLIQYCRKRAICCTKYGHYPVRHEEPVIVGPSTNSSTDTTTQDSDGARTTRAPSGQVRHDYLRQNPDRIRNLRQNGPRREQQPHRTPSRRLNNWRYQRNFVSMTQQSVSVTVNGVEQFASEYASNGQNFASSFNNSQSTGQDSFFVSIFTNSPQGQQNTNVSTDNERNSGSADTGISNSTKTSHSKEESVPSDSTLRDQPPPSYENAQAYPPVYTSDKDDLSSSAPPYSSGSS